MIDELKLLRGENIEITDRIFIRNSLLGEIADFGERSYYSMVSMLCSTPTDYMVFLKDKFNIDWDKIGEYEWFVIMYKSLSADGAKMLFGFDITELEKVLDKTNNKICLINNSGQVVINEEIYFLIVDYVRKMHGFKKNCRKAGNDYTRKTIIKQERKKLERLPRSSQQYSVLAPLISALVNSSGFKYDYNTIWNLNIFAFTDALKRVQKINNYNQIMNGIYSGTIDVDKMDKNNLDWLGTID